MRLLTLLTAAILVSCGQSQAPADFQAGPDREPQTQRPHTPKPDSTPVPDPVPEDPKPDPIPEEGSDMVAFLEMCEDDQYDGEGRVTIDALFAEYGGSNCEELAEILRPLTTVSLNNYGITSLEPIAELDNLVQVKAMGNKISDLRPLAKLPKLRAGVFLLNAIQTLDGLESVQSLKYLVLDGNSLRDITALCGTTGLVWLDLRQTPGSDSQIEDGFDCIGNHPDLELLYLDGHLLKNRLGFLSRLPELKKFGGAFSDIDDIDFLANRSPKMEQIYLDNNKITDISVLSEFKSLTHLSIYNNEVSDISPLHRTNRLSWFLYDESSVLKNEVNCPSGIDLPPAIKKICFGEQPSH